MPRIDTAVSSSQEQSPIAQRAERLAINVYDCDRLEPTLRTQLLAGRLQLDKPFKTDWDRKDAKDEVAVPFSCDLLTAAIICDIIRNYDNSAGDFPTRFYIFRKAWSRVPSNRVLSILVDGKTQLNPQLFAVGHRLVASEPLEPEPVCLGKK